MVAFQGLFLILIGGGLLGVTYQSLSKGWLPCGPNGLRGQLRFRRDAQPVTYWTMFGAYTLGGLWALSYGIGVLAGTVEPLPWN
jgi:hypothetical protein